ncbi:hypothetical protein [Pseudomonas amygdali]|uniref:Uncharacterized protein n=2 Tax=Pseudomonas amygdali pv. lachrymans TaxID=53707 RepID=A0ABR5KQS1_PSEAV|nr:hypothetical protein [Pseudomonas amygdali]AXH59579.1 hypothetical protein PLA107_030605 [Pseudomonas amygdali pv. lachrymans str. M301315]KPC17005.1 Uncharacterized protein AC499_0207 [Pseudomonas amygdali pv. lachrymans]KPC17964.1 Uncharacterized protein AC499_1166 [Pseudomonas amygdali pv. lachrymans]RMT06231.1 hypothetical protein ALP54_03500 [Pseudomonas amygdali pv. lachrymans]
MIDQQILDLYRQTYASYKGPIDRDLFAAAAQKIEVCLMSFIGQYDPVVDLLNEVSQDSKAQGVEIFFGYPVKSIDERNEQKKLVAFMLATTMSAPTQNLPRIFSAYMLFINDMKYQLKGTFEAYGKNKIGDMRSLIRLANPDHLKRMMQISCVSNAGALIDAIANDDMEAYNRAWAVYTHADEWKEKFGMLALFPIEPDTAVHKALIVTDQDKKDLFLARIFALRHDVENTFCNGINYSRNPDPSRSTLFPNYENAWPICAPNHEQPFYMQPGFALGVQQDTTRCIQGFFAPKRVLEIRAHDGWDHIDRITQAFLDAGVSAQHLLTYGLCRENQGAPLVSMQHAIGRLGMCNKEDLRFYRAAFQALFRDFDTKTLLGYCATDESRRALYEVTRDKDVLRLAGDRARDGALASDLGL